MSTDILPTRQCTPELHEKYGGACYWCCDTCNHDAHRCHFCGDFLRHDGRQQDGTINECYARCACRHIGHEHSSDNTCRGMELTSTGWVETDCGCGEYRPVAL